MRGGVSLGDGLGVGLGWDRLGAVLRVGGVLGLGSGLGGGLGLGNREGGGLGLGKRLGGVLGLRSGGGLGLGSGVGGGLGLGSREGGGLGLGSGVGLGLGNGVGGGLDWRSRVGEGLGLGRGVGLGLGSGVGIGPEGDPGTLLLCEDVVLSNSREKSTLNISGCVEGGVEAGGLPSLALRAILRVWTEERVSFPPYRLLPQVTAFLNASSLKPFNVVIIDAITSL